jgi:hypothetical protein
LCSDESAPLAEAALPIDMVRARRIYAGFVCVVMEWLEWSSQRQQCSKATPARTYAPAAASTPPRCPRPLPRRRRRLPSHRSPAWACCWLLLVVLLLLLLPLLVGPSPAPPALAPASAPARSCPAPASWMGALLAKRKAHTGRRSCPVCVGRGVLRGQSVSQSIGR